MVLESTGRLYKRGNRVYIYIPSNVSLDSTFPFDFEKGDIKVKIDGKKIVIEKA